MSSYYCAGTFDNPGNLNLAEYLSNYRTKFDAALAVGMPFIGKIGFGNSPVIGLWFATNADSRSRQFDDLFSMLRRGIDSFLLTYGVPADCILKFRPTWEGEGRTKTILDINPHSKTRLNRKRMGIHKAYWHVRDASNHCILDKPDISEGMGEQFFEWCKHNEGILPREGEMPLENLYSPGRYPYGAKYGRIRNDLLVANQ